MENEKTVEYMEEGRGEQKRGNMKQKIKTSKGKKQNKRARHDRKKMKQ